MIAYVYRKSDNIITDKITNVRNCETDNRGNIEITGDTISILGNSFDYMVLDEGIYNAEVGSTFNKDHFNDKSSSLQLTSEEKMTQNIANLNNSINALNSNFQSFIDYVMTNVSGLPQ